jgi:hypothetical protein
MNALLQKRRLSSSLNIHVPRKYRECSKHYRPAN